MAESAWPKAGDLFGICMMSAALFFLMLAKWDL